MSLGSRALNAGETIRLMGACLLSVTKVRPPNPDASPRLSKKGLSPPDSSARGDDDDDPALVEVFGFRMKASHGKQPVCSSAFHGGMVVARALQNVHTHRERDLSRSMN